MRSYVSLTAAAQSIRVAKSSMALAISQGRVLEGCVWRYSAEGDEKGHLSVERERGREAGGGMAWRGGDCEKEESDCEELR